MIRSWKELVVVRQELHDTREDHQSYLKIEEPVVCWTKECILSGILVKNSSVESNLEAIGYKRKNISNQNSRCTDGIDGRDS